jgi:hypothetical protein
MASAPASLAAVPDDCADVLLAAQWPGAAVLGRCAHGPPALACAVLVDALQCAGFVPSRRHRPVPPAIRREARSWLLGPPTDAPLSLEIACQLVGVEPAQLRQQLARAAPRASRLGRSRGPSPTSQRNGHAAREKLLVAGLREGQRRLTRGGQDVEFESRR